MSMDLLKKQLKQKDIGKLYLFTGPEQFLIRYYEKNRGHVIDKESRTLTILFRGKTVHE